MATEVSVHGVTKTNKKWSEISSPEGNHIVLNLYLVDILLDGHNNNILLTRYKYFPFCTFKSGGH